MSIPALPSLDRTSPTFRTDLDTFFLSQLPATTGAFNAEIDRINAIGYGSYNATSTTSLTVGTGTKSLTVDTAKGYVVGQTLLIASTASPTNWMSGQVTSYDSGTGALVINATLSSGSGTLAAWTVSVTSLAIGAAPTITQRTITGADTLIASDQGKLVNASGTFTLSVTAAATLGNGWYCWLRNTGTGTVTLDPNGAETVDGVTTGPVRDTVLLVCDGTGFSAAKVGPHSAIETLTTGTSWTCPLGVRRIKLRAVGGGGAGVSTGVVGQGGSSGGYIEKAITVVPATAYTYAIGAGGTGVVNDWGGAGGDTTFTAGGTTYTAGGAGVSGATGAATTGDFNLPGRRGTGAPVSGNFSSLGGDTPLGAAGRNHPAQGSYAPVGYGAGGFGTPSGTAGGSGAPGVIILEY